MNSYTEERLESLIEKHLIESNGYIKRDSKSYNKELCLDEELLFRFLERSQKEALDQLKKRIGVDYQKQLSHRLYKQIAQKGIVHILREGISENGVRFDLLFDKPQTDYNPLSTKRYQENIFSVIRQLYYSTKNRKSIDMVIFVNGIPMITIELKNELSGQNIYDGIEQYKKDRDPREELLKFGRCVVHFTLDSELIYMTTKLDGAKTVFLPFNRGLNGGKGYIGIQTGAGNPESNGVKTAYFWEEILSKDILTHIFKNYVQMFDKVDKRLIFPRFHQFDVVHKLLADAKEYGAGKRYLIQHSAGSGKSNSISWLAHQLTGLHNSENSLVFDSVIVVTDRKVLDKQIQDNIQQFYHKKGVVKAITKGSKELRESLQEGKKIIISTIQKFPYIVKDVSYLKRKTFAIIIDEAHSSQSGKTAQKLSEAIRDKDGEELTDEDKIVEIIKNKKLQPNASYFAFTATPKAKTKELFGSKIIVDGQEKFIPFHLYSMKQAIEEGFILNVLDNYITYNSYYNLKRTVKDDPEYDKKRANAKLKKYVEGDERTIQTKAKIMIDHFNTYSSKKIKNRAKAMVVTSSREHAIKYYQAFKKYLEHIGSIFEALVAFSDEIDIDGISYTESGLNGFGEAKLKDNFKDEKYRFLIVADKYQTGFDEPLLHTMYVDKKLGGVAAVQTLSRLNRTMTNKEDTFVMDFYNSSEDIKEAFSKFYETTYLKEATDPNILFDLMGALNDFEIYTVDIVNDFVSKVINNEKEPIIHAILDSVKNEYDTKSDDEQIDFIQKTTSFLRLYAFLSQILPYEDVALERLYIFLKILSTKIKPKRSEDLAQGILDNVDFDSYRVQLDKKEDMALESDGELKPISSDDSRMKPEPELDFLSNIIEGFNERFGDIDLGEDDEVKRSLKEIREDVISDDEFIASTKNADEQNMKITFDKVLKDKFHNIIETNFLLFQKFNNDPEFKEFLSTKLFEDVKYRVEGKHADVR